MFDPRNSKPDGFQVVNRGVHSGIAPNTLSRNQFAWAINTTFRNGLPETRPGWVRRDLTWESEETEATFLAGLWQGAGALSVRNQLIAAVGNRIYMIDVDSWTGQDVSVDDSTATRQVWMAEANGFLVVQNGRDKAFIWDGASGRRADPFGEGGTREIPTGTVMRYANSRLWVASPDRTSFVAGDIAFGPTGTLQYGRADSVLKFTENTYLNEGGAFGVPENSGQITAMAPVGQLDTATGQGPLQVFTTSAIFSINAPTDRTQWKNLTNPIQSVSMVDAGATSWTSPVAVNSDIWFRSVDGIRSFGVGRRDFGTWANLPQSYELTRVMDLDDTRLLDYSSSAVFDNRLLTTVSPQFSYDHGVYHMGLAALDFSGVTALGSEGQPSWEGVWTGLRILQLVSGTFSGVRRCFAFALSSDDEIQLWELTRDIRFDIRGTESVPIVCSVETGAYNWNSGFDLLKLVHGCLWYDELEGTVQFSVYYRPDQEPCWKHWSSWSSCAAMETCLTEDSATGCAAAPLTLSKQYRRRRVLPQPADDVDTRLGKLYRTGDEFQIRIAWRGSVKLRKLRLWAIPVAEALSQVQNSSDGVLTTDQEVDA